MDRTTGRSSSGRSSSVRLSGGSRSESRSDSRDRLRSRDRQDSVRSGSRRSLNQPVQPQRSGVPVPLVLLLMVMCLAASALLTRCAMMPSVTKANEELAAAQEQVTSLTRQIEQKDRELEAAAKENMSDTSTGDASNATKAGGVDSPWTTSGKYTSGDSTLDQEVKDFCDSKADSSMSQADAALEVYKGIAWSDYVERDSAQNPSGKNWRLEYARQYYENGCSGNCYEFASFLMYCLQYMGFADAKAEGVLVQLQSGGWGDHGIVYVTGLDGTACICDTARGTNAWMIPESTYNVQLQDFENA